MLNVPSRGCPTAMSAPYPFLSTYYTTPLCFVFSVVRFRPHFMLLFEGTPHEIAWKSVLYEPAIPSLYPLWSYGPADTSWCLGCRRLRSALTEDNPTAIWAYNLLRTQHFHGVSSASPHACSLTSRYGKVSKIASSDHKWHPMTPSLYLVAGVKFERATTALRDSQRSKLP